MKDDKTTCQLGADYNKLTKVQCYIQFNLDSCIKYKFENLSLKIIKYTSKICIIYLKLHNQPFPVKFDKKEKLY